MRDLRLRVYEFGPFRLDAAAGRLLRHGQEVPLSVKLFDILLTLVREHGRVVSKESLLARVWPHLAVEENNLTVRMSALRKVLGESPEGGGYIQTVPTRGYRFVAPVREVGDGREPPRGAALRERRAEGPSGAGEKAIDSLAVLPLVNVGGDPELAYLCDGVAESLINTLSSTPHLRVMARNTVFRYREQDADARQIGRGLDVRAVLVGRLLRRGRRLVVSVELVNAEDGAQLWGARFAHDYANLLALEEEIAREIMAGLRLKLTGAERTRLSKRYTEVAEAYQLFLKGRYLWNKRSSRHMREAVRYFEQAISLDPHYALAYVGLADTYNLLRTSGALPPHESIPAIRQLLQRALELDEELADAHATLGYIKVSYDWDWEGALSEFRRALELNPNCVTARQWHALYLRARGRFEEAIHEMQSAQRLDPLSPSTGAGLGATYYCARQYDRAVAALQGVLELAPDSTRALALLGLVYVEKEMHDEAIAAGLKLNALCDDAEASALLGFIYAMAGRAPDARRLLDRLTALAGHNYVEPSYFALVHIGLGQLDEAFGWLELASRSRDEDLIMSGVDPRLDRLRPDPRFARLLKLIGLDD